MALTEKDFVEVARAMNEATGLTACHSGDAENMVAAIRRSGLDLIALNETISHSQAEAYPHDWQRVSVMVSPNGNDVHYAAGDMKAWRKLHDRIYGEPKSTGTAMPDTPFNPEDEPPYFRNG